MNAAELMKRFRWVDTAVKPALGPIPMSKTQAKMMHEILAHVKQIMDRSNERLTKAENGDLR